MNLAIAPDPKPPVLLIDLSALFWSAWHSSGEDLTSAARSRTLDAVQRCESAVPGALVAICCDSGRSFRKDIYPQYKANRPEKDHAVIGELQRTIEHLRRSGHLIWACPDLEADDVIATASTLATIQGHTVVIATGDKDLYQLIDDGHVSVLSTRTWEMRSADDVIAKFGVEPAMLGDLLALTGDKSDGIPGCPGVGNKRAADLLTAHGTLEGIFTALHAGTIQATPSITAALKGHEGAVGLARTLVELRFNAPVKFNEIYETREPIPQPKSEDVIAMEETKPGHMDVVVTTGPEDDDLPSTEAMIQRNERAPGMTIAPMPARRAIAPMPVNNNARFDPRFEMAFEPADAVMLLKAATMLHESGLYKKFHNVQSIWAVVIRGREMGLKMGESLDSFHVIEGKPAATAQLLIAKAKAHPDCEYLQCIETTSTTCTWETKVRGNPKPTRLTYTIADAELAGLRGGTWAKRPTEMLRKTCGVQLARLEYPDAALGLYCAEELGSAAAA